MQEVAFTLANGIDYVQGGHRRRAGRGRLCRASCRFFFNAHNNFLEEVAKFRAARRLWAQIMRERFGAKDPRSWRLRFHTQTGGTTLTAQQPENNIVRVTLQALAAVLGGTQSLHTNSKDEALALPTQKAVEVALRTQQIIAYESGVADTVDPLAGSYYVEWLTDEIERRASEYIDKIDELGGALKAIEEGYIQREIQDAAYHTQRVIEKGEQVVVGVNRFQTDETQHRRSAARERDCAHQADGGAAHAARRARQCRRAGVLAKIDGGRERPAGLAHAALRGGGGSLRHAGRDL